MGRIVLFVLIVICLIGVIHGGMECPLPSNEDVFKLSKKSCPRPDLDSEEKIFCCINPKTETAYCCNPFEWVSNTASNGGLLPSDVLTTVSSGPRTNLQQNSSIVLCLSFIYFIIIELSPVASVFSR